MTDHLTEDELAAAIEYARRQIDVGGVYAHYRDPSSRYLVTGLAIIEATQEVGVIYRKQVGSEALRSLIWIRPLSSWLESVSVSNQLVPRFCKVE